MNLLEKSRKRINEIDQKMTELFEERMEVVKDVLQYKKENSLPVFDEGREVIVLKNSQQYLKDSFFIPYQQQFMQQIMHLSKDYQYHLLSQNQVAYQGVEGAFSYIATKKLFPNFECIAKETFEALFQAVSNNEVPFAVVPFENSYTGDVGEVLDLLYEYNVSITAVYDLKVEQNLLALLGTKLEDIEQIYSHSQAIQQSLPFLKDLDVELISYENTALAAKYVHDAQNPTKAAIAAKETAELYQLDILAKNIQASDDNTTRFIVISNKANTSGNRISILFATRHEAGELSKVIQMIGQYGFNLESIKSRSSKKIAWQYYFYLEIQADFNNEQVQQMLEEIKEIAIDFKITGIYSR